MADYPTPQGIEIGQWVMFLDDFGTAYRCRVSARIANGRVAVTEVVVHSRDFDGLTDEQQDQLIRGLLECAISRVGGFCATDAAERLIR